MLMVLLAPVALAGALAGPTFSAVRSVTRRRAFAPLVRGSVERACVLAASGLAAAGLCAQLVLLLGGMPFHMIESVATYLFFLLAPPILGAAPWTAGEVLSGPSARHEESFAAALVSAYFAGALGFYAGVTAGTGVALVVAAAAAALGATITYLCVRGATPAR
jgi:hypothetical protein